MQGKEKCDIVNNGVRCTNYTHIVTNVGLKIVAFCASCYKERVVEMDDGTKYAGIADQL